MHYPHVVHFAGPLEESLVGGASSFIRRAVADGTCVVFTSRDRWNSFVCALQSNGEGANQALSDRRLKWYDADPVLKAVFRGGRIDPYQFDLHVGTAMRDAVANSGARPVYAYGDLVDVLWSRGERRAAADLEWYWNDLGAQLPFSLYCAYAVHAGAEGLEPIVRSHSATVNF